MGVTLDGRQSRDGDTHGGQGIAARSRVAFAGVLGTVSGIAPHVLHHVGPIAGAAIISGATGTIVFGAAGLLLMIPSLVRLKRHFGTLLVPALALVVFATLFMLSSLWVGPAIRGGAAPDGHSPDHPGHAAASPVTRALERRSPQ